MVYGPHTHRSMNKNSFRGSPVRKFAGYAFAILISQSAYGVNCTNGTKNLTATLGAPGQVNLNWAYTNTSSSSVYKIQRRSTSQGTFIVIASISYPTTSFIDGGVSAATPYTYEILCNGGSQISNLATVEVPSLPATPSGLSATAVSGTRVNLSWIDNSSNETQYYVERSVGVDGNYGQLAVLGANAVAFSDGGLSGGTTYFYRVRASNGGGYSGYSNEGSAAPPTLPIAPSALGTVVMSGTQVTLNWTDNSTNESAFKIERKTGAPGAYAQIAVTAANVGTYSDGGVVAGNVYYYRVRATNLAGDSAYSNEAVGTDLVPAAPGNLLASLQGQTKVTLTWADNSTNESGFKIERKTGRAGSYSQIATVGTNGTSYSDATVAPGTPYYYRVRATNTVGDSSYSNEAGTGSGSTLSIRTVGHWLK